MITRIEMLLNSYKILIKKETNQYYCQINDKNCILSDEDIDNLIRIIRNWEHTYQNNNLIERNINYIKIISEEQEYNYIFNNKFPNNFTQLLDYLRGIYAR